MMGMLNPEEPDGGFLYAEASCLRVLDLWPGRGLNGPLWVLYADVESGGNINNKTRMTWQFLTSLQPRAYIDDVEKTYQKEARDISMNIGSQRPVGSEESLFK